MDEIVHKISAWDGFSLVVREWRDGNARTPLLCLPGIVRTSGDFETFAHALGAGRRVVSPDYAGRGQSGRSRDITRYAPEACLRDVLDICAALHLHQAIAIGTTSARRSAAAAPGSCAASSATMPHSPTSARRLHICARCCRRYRWTAMKHGGQWLRLPTRPTVMACCGQCGTRALRG
jgi:hypothetical protein